jgi:Fe-S-cluster-containing dehydrogenase component/DMSO reductase anchor subunit
VKPVLADLLGEVFRERDAWTAVESFSSWHGEGHAQSRHYEGLVPLSTPVAGERYAFDVDLDRCSGCKACVTACHSLNGLDEGESWRQVGLLREPGLAAQFTVTSSCHHCEDPACSNGCPTLAYEKLDNGIVKHLDDQCMGCRYCEWTCPYGAPQWNAERGIVRKCDLCHSRLREGEAPACVQACPNGAIAVRLVPVQGAERSGTMDLPGVVEPAFTRPSTRYLAKDPFSSRLRPAHEDTPEPQEPHIPLAFLLVATQAGAGLAVFALFQNRALPWRVSFVLALAGIGVGSAHLGHPERAWKAILNLRRSWFSREVAGFGLFAGLLGLRAFGGLSPIAVSASLAEWNGGAAAVVGLLSVGASAMLYMVTRRPTWHHPSVALRFASTVILLGSATGTAFHTPGAGLRAVVLGLSGQFLAEVWSVSGAPGAAGRMLLVHLRGPLALRIALGFAGMALVHPHPLAGAIVLFAATFAERILFFRTALPARMPGGFLG